MSSHQVSETQYLRRDDINRTPFYNGGDEGYENIIDPSTGTIQTSNKEQTMIPQINKGYWFSSTPQVVGTGTGYNP